MRLLSGIAGRPRIVTALQDYDRTKAVADDLLERDRPPRGRARSSASE
jgi:hypothetical protein